jgi:phospholipid/cholesterol/gamma-HCH transport system substrate-binding protein
MKNNKRAVFVGLFVLLALTIFITAILVLGGQQKQFVPTVQIKALFNNVGGLKAGNNVWFSGVKIGTVRRLSFTGVSQVEVDMNIEEKAVPYIHKDALASLSSDGLIGNKIVVISGGTPQHPPVEAGDQLGIQGSLSSEQLLDTLQITNRNLLKISQDVQSIIGGIKQGKGMAGAVLGDEQLADNFRQTVVGLRAAAVQANRITASLAQFSGNLNRKGTLAHELVTDTVVIHDLRVTSARLRQASTSALGAIEQINQTTAKLNRPNSPLNTLLTDEESGQNLKLILRNLTEGSAILNEDLKAAQNNFLLRGYFRKKDKEKAKQAEN